MSEQRLNRAIDRLRVEINRLEGIDEDARARMKRLLKDIERPRPPAGDEIKQGNLVQRLQDEVASFGATHPELTAALDEVLEILTAAGI
jgi:prefoldin subunit 5